MSKLYRKKRLTFSRQPGAFESTNCYRCRKKIYNTAEVIFKDFVECKKCGLMRFVSQRILDEIHRRKKKAAELTTATNKKESNSEARKQTFGLLSYPTKRRI